MSTYDLAEEDRYESHGSLVTTGPDKITFTADSLDDALHNDHLLNIPLQLKLGCSFKDQVQDDYSGSNSVWQGQHTLWFKMEQFSSADEDLNHDKVSPWTGAQKDDAEGMSPSWNPPSASGVKACPYLIIYAGSRCSLDHSGTPGAPALPPPSPLLCAPLCTSALALVPSDTSRACSDGRHGLDERLREARREHGRGAERAARHHPRDRGRARRAGVSRWRLRLWSNSLDDHQHAQGPRLRHRRPQGAALPPEAPLPPETAQRHDVLLLFTAPSTLLTHRPTCCCPSRLGWPSSRATTTPSTSRWRPSRWPPRPSASSRSFASSASPTRSRSYIHPLE